MSKDAWLLWDSLKLAYGQIVSFLLSLNTEPLVEINGGN